MKSITRPSTEQVDYDNPETQRSALDQELAELLGLLQEAEEAP